MAARWGNGHSQGQHLERILAKIVVIKVLCDIFQVEGLRTSN